MKQERKEGNKNPLVEEGDEKVPPPKFKVICAKFIGLVNIVINREIKEDGENNGTNIYNVKKQEKMLLGCIFAFFCYTLYCLKSFWVIEVAGMICIYYTFDSWIHIVIGIIALFVAIVLYSLFKKD